MKSFDEYFNKICSAILLQTNYEELEKVYAAIYDCFSKGRTLYIFGNGGSAAIANHWVCDVTKGISEDTVKPTTAISLSSNVPLITAIANDYGYEYIFSKQLQYLRPSVCDIALAVSSSGNSKNVVLALELAKELGLKTIALTGFNGGVAKEKADLSVHVDVHNYGIVEDTHMMILHAISQRLRYSWAPKPETVKL